MIEFLSISMKAEKAVETCITWMKSTYPEYLVCLVLSDDRLVYCRYDVHTLRLLVAFYAECWASSAVCYYLPFSQRETSPDYTSVITHKQWHWALAACDHLLSKKAVKIRGNISNEACQCSKFSSHYFLISTNQIALLLTECWTATQIFTECCISTIGNFHYTRREKMLCCDVMGALRAQY